MNQPQPGQFLALFPSLANNTLIVNQSACASQSANCPRPQPNLFQWSDADEASGTNRTMSEDLTASEFDPWYASLLNMSGNGQWFSETMNLHPADDNSVSDVIDYLVMGVSNTYSAGFPNGAEYTLDTGFV